MYQSTALMAHLFIVAKMHIKKAPLREQWSLDGSFAVLLDDLVPWQDVIEVLWMPLDVGVRQVLEEAFEVLERVQVASVGSPVFCQADFPIFVVGISHRHRGKIPTFSGPCQEAGSTTASCRMRACSIR